MNLLKIKGVTSYSNQNFVTLDLSKRINLIYGQNGSGKSTISNYFYEPGNSNFSECESNFNANFKYVVYNQRFIEDNFYTKEGQPGVFTLSKENAELEKTIKDKDREKSDLLIKFKTIEADIKTNEEREKAEIENCTNKIWDKFDPIRQTSLRELMKGNLRIASFFTKVASEKKPQEINLALLANEYDGLIKHKGVLLSTIVEPTQPKLTEDEVKLLAEPVLSSGSSYLSELITKLNNLDWVKIGYDNYIFGKKCPFCQSDTIDENIKLQLKSLFDQSYIDRINKIENLKKKYNTATQQYLSDLTTMLENNPPTVEIKKPTTLSIIKIKIASNLSKFDEKLKSPRTEIFLESLNDEIEEISKYVQQLNKEITEINNKTRKFTESESEIQKRLWSGLKFASQDILSLHTSSLKAISDKVTDLKTNAELIKKQGVTLRNEIITLRSQVSNIEDTIDKINRNLKILGISGFEIRKTQDTDYYTIARGNNVGSSVYKSLSEGEKTLITLLYFLELCKGKTNTLESEDKETLVVIDDPISSLSQNYVYDVASFIHYEIIKEDKLSKIVILTHNLFFFHELLKLAPKNSTTFTKNYTLYRVIKSEFTSIEEISKKELQNEYQALWQILRDAKVGKVHGLVIPNIMRNILEYYFSFVHKSDRLEEELCKLTSEQGDSQFRSFYRFINRGSHSDSTNITEIGSVSPEIYLELFKKVFIATGDDSHYIKMMDELENELQ
ncbi:AAA family ATPase [Serratia fonticola]|uniref:AAA family ATPase n=1 Tax=Serratia fonticola TaxID=47917 RepID=A0AAE7EIZ2_SERFO|nr:AAA family ATPase [Serratia fonticola]QKJ59381.2 AAA family ATPase [Serratia fonticola]